MSGRHYVCWAADPPAVYTTWNSDDYSAVPALNRFVIRTGRKPQWRRVSSHHIAHKILIENYDPTFMTPLPVNKRYRLLMTSSGVILPTMTKLPREESLLDSLDTLDIHGKTSVDKLTPRNKKSSLTRDNIDDILCAFAEYMKEKLA